MMLNFTFTIQRDIISFVPNISKPFVHQPKKKSKFLGFDKSDQQTFSLVARSRKDIHEGDATTGQNVLVAMETLGEGDVVDQKDLSNFGIYYDDEYDYGQHIRTIDEFYENTLVKEAAPTPTRKIRLPATVFADEPNDNDLDNDEGGDFDTDVLDPDVEAALAEDAEIDNDLEDDFIAMANAAPSDEMDADNEERLRNFRESKSAVWAKFFDRAGLSSDEDEEMTETERKPMTVRTRGGRELTEQELVLEKQFEKMYEEFTKDGEDLETGSRMTGTTAVSESLSYLVSRDQAMFAADNVKPAGLNEEDPEEGALKSKTLALIAEDESEPSDSEQDPDWAKSDRRQRIDCDVTSVRSSVIPENIPRVMEIPGSSKPSRSRITSSVLEPMDEHEDDVESTVQVLPARESGESTENKRARKKAVKDAQRLRRVEKKINRTAFQNVFGQPVVVKSMKLS